MNGIKKIFWETIKILESNKILEHVVLIGSWAEYIYEKSGCLKNFEANLKTRDIDFLIRNINKPREGINIVDILEKEGFETSIDYMSGIYKFYRGKDLELEFLVREIGRGQSEPYEVPSFGIKAEGLRNTDILIDNIDVIEVMDIKIIVPNPQAYLLQKIIINNQRKSKAEKDYLGIENLLENIKSSDLEFQKLKDLFNVLTKKQKKIISKFLNGNLLELF
ncbi:MAG: GSU2403 family nucleotidyltransferase fold protein [Actinomycetota bacterium]|nr:GSU2403 family nucleotidyltransferase fold protein [Actinomycetota bacterium]